MTIKAPRCYALLRFSTFVIALCCTMALVVWAEAGENPAPPITSVFVDVSRLHHDPLSNGDTWDYIWADDDNLYSFACDGRGYGKPGGRNVNFNKLAGQWPALTGIGVNPLDYGKSGQKWPNGSNWKATGGDCIDGVIYGFIAENWYGSQNAYGGADRDGHLRQTVTNMSLIKSTDKGLTWSRDTQSNYDKPMWTSTKFSTGFFFKYGRDGGATTQDDQDKFVYVVSNDGYWNCGSAFYLGRVARSKIGGLSAADWRYYADGAWSSNIDEATPIPGFPNGQTKCTGGSPIWLDGLRKYVTVTWYDPATTTRWHYPENVTFAFYQADHPWGPWSYIGEKSCNDFIGDPHKRISRWYGPSLSPKFIVNNPDGSVTAILTFSGQLWADKPDSLYKNNSCPVTFYTKPQPSEVEVVNDTEGHYSPNWTYETKRGVGDYLDDAHVTSTPGEYVDFTFTGRGIEVFSEKSSALGQVEVLLDGVSKGDFPLYQDPMPRLYQVAFYHNLDLTEGFHTIRVTNKSADNTPCLIDGFRVYHGDNFDPNAHYMLINRVTRQALASATVGDSSELQLAGPDGSAHVQWVIQPGSDPGFHTLTDVAGGKLLRGDPSDANTLALQPSTVKAPTLWSIIPVGNGTYSIISQSSGMAICADKYAPDGAPAVPAPYYGRDLQKWEIIRLH